MSQFTLFRLLTARGKSLWNRTFVDKLSLVQVMDWRRAGDKPLPEPMMTHFNDAYIRNPASVTLRWFPFDNTNMYFHFISFFATGMSQGAGIHSHARQKHLQWRHIERDGVSSHRRLDCVLNRLFRRRSKKTSKLRVTGLFEGKCLNIMTTPGSLTAHRVESRDWKPVNLVNHIGKHKWYPRKTF